MAKATGTSTKLSFGKEKAEKHKKHEDQNKKPFLSIEVKENN